MSAAFMACLNFVLNPQQDGQGLHTTPGDPGGATDDGITLETFRNYCDDPDLTATDLSKISAAQIQAIYATKFWNPVRGDDLPPPVALMVMDHAVNCGTTTSGRLLQNAAGLRGEAVDGWIGAETLSAVHQMDIRALIERLSTAQSLYYRACRGFAEFGRGWLLRLARREAAALQLLAV